MFFPPLTLQRNLTDKLPSLLVKKASWIPFSLQRLTLELVLQYALLEALQEGELDFLEGHYVRIHIEDVDLCWYITCHKQQLIIKQHAQASISIRGNLKEFIRLAARSEDPDTLFFQRQLVIEGNTEIGLEIKNLFDSLDLDSLPLTIRKGVDLAARIFI